MKNSFETSIKNKVEQFNEIPSDKTWTSISEKLNSTDSLDSSKTNPWRLWGAVVAGVIILGVIFWKINPTQAEALQKTKQQPVAQQPTIESANAQKVVSEGKGNMAIDMFPLELEAARKANKLLMVYVCMEGCKPCARFVKETLSQPDVEEYLSENFNQVAVDMKAKENLPFLKNYETNASPSVLFFRPDGEFLGKTMGAVPKEEFMGMARQVTKMGIE